MTPREYLLKNLLVDVIGPGSEGKDNPEGIEHEWISESPLSRYFLGILYPQKLTTENITLMDPSEDEKKDDSNQIEIDVKQMENDGGNVSEEVEDDNLVKDIYSFSPSACGLSFVISGQTTKINCCVNAATYQRLNPADVFLKLDPDELALMRKYSDICGLSIVADKIFINQVKNEDLREDLNVDKNDAEVFWPIYRKLINFKKHGYRRSPIENRHTFQLSHSTKEIFYDVPNSLLKIKVKNRAYEGNKQIITVSLFNDAQNDNERVHDIEKCYFQCSLEISIEDEGHQFIDVKQLQIGDLDDLQTELLYRNRKVYGIGHGCSVSWEGNPPVRIKTSFAPTHEVPRVGFFHPRLEKLNLDIFKQRNLAYAKDTERESIVGELQRFVEDYEKWLIDERKLVEGAYKIQIENNYAKCELIKSRIAEGIKILQFDDFAWQAFKDTNRAMIMQRFHAEEIEQNEEGEYKKFDVNTSNLPYENVPDSKYEWRPFQLAFLLLSLKSITDPNSYDRSIADLIWFPTGGGKTEAYLGLIAFTIFYRRQVSGELGFGTTVLMRYTLRLLTSDQFKRACSLILACEVIRRQNLNHYGSKDISIGFWVGSGVSPNTRVDARQYVTKLTDDEDGFNQHIKDYPFQVLNCPWCGSSLINTENLEKSGFRMGRGQSFGFYCINKFCSFHEGLPIQVVDEELYKTPPTLLFATVDKFAALPWQEDTRVFFGYQVDDNGKISQANKPPDLIIQDELHLISGPLGSIFGHYESTIDFLCRHGGYIPKIVCSTATVTKADEQIRAVFDREASIFPPSAYNIEDSYFAIEKPLDETPGRLYLGLSSIGKTFSSTYIKIISSLLFHKFQLMEKSEGDLDGIELQSCSIYSTIVSYFNALNSLAQATGFFYDDIPEKMQIKRNVSRLGRGHRIVVRELTSRLTGTELPTILRELKNENSEISLLLTTNMFSVGIDISRLNLFLMSNQPKSTSEYIQSTSRVGRRDAGLVITLYDNFRARDKSFYENFQAFHQGFYRFVEPNGVTPFARPVRLRALHALAITVYRLLIQSGDRAAPFSAQSLTRKEIWIEFRDFLMKRCGEIDAPQKQLLASEIDSFLREWETMANKHGADFFFKNISYNNNLDKKRPPLMIPAGRSDKEWPMAKNVLQSMRNVDVNTTLKLEG